MPADKIDATAEIETIADAVPVGAKTDDSLIKDNCKGGCCYVIVYACPVCFDE